ASAGVAAARAAQRLAQRAGDDVHAAHDIVVFVSSPAAPAHEADGVGIVHHHQGVVFFREVTNAAKICDVTIHGEHAVGGDHFEPGLAGVLQLRLEVGHVAVE